MRPGPRSSEERKAERDDIRAAYQSSIQLAIHESQLAWRETAVFLTFSLVLIAGAALPDKLLPLGSEHARLVSFVGVLFSIVGLVASVMWRSIVLRCRSWHDYWVVNARELEQLMSPAVQTLQRGKGKSNRQAVMVDGENMEFEGFVRIPLKPNFKFFYTVFIAVFFLLGVINFFTLLHGPSTTATPDPAPTPVPTHAPPSTSPANSPIPTPHR